MKKTYVSFLGTGTYKPCVYLKPDAPATIREWSPMCRPPCASL